MIIIRILSQEKYQLLFKTQLTFDVVKSQFYSEHDIERRKKMLSIIVAIAKNNAIGKDNKLLWHLPEDLKE